MFARKAGCRPCSASRRGHVARRPLRAPALQGALRRHEGCLSLAVGRMAAEFGIRSGRGSCLRGISQQSAGCAADRTSHRDQPAAAGSLMSPVPEMAPDVARIFDACPAITRSRLLALRRLIFDTAGSLAGVGPLTET